MLKDDDELPTKRLWDMVPKRNLLRAITMLFVLVAIVFMQRESGKIVEALTVWLGGPPPQARPVEPPRVRMAPPEPHR